MSFANKSLSIFTRDIFLFILNLFTSVVIARKLGPELLGVWVIVMLIPGYAEAFGRSKFDLASVFFLGKKKYTESEVVYNINIIAIITSLFIVLLIFMFKSYLVSLLFNESKDNVIFIYAVLPLIPLNFMYLNYSYLLISREDIKAYNFMTILKALIGSGGASILILIFNFGLWSVLTSNIIAVLIGFLYGRWKFNKKSKKRIFISNLNIPLIKEFFNYSYKLYLGGIVSHLNSFLMTSLLSVYLAPAKVAFYSTAQGRASLLDKLPVAINTLLYPRISNSEKHDAIETTIKAFKIISIFSIFSVFLVAMFIKPIVIILYGKQYLPIIAPFLIILPGVSINGIASVFASYFTGIGRSDLIMKLSVFPLLLQILLGYLLITKFDILGAAMSYTVSMIIFGIIQMYYFVKITGNSFKELIPVSQDYLYIYNFCVSNLKPPLKIFKK